MLPITLPIPTKEFYLKNPLRVFQVTNLFMVIIMNDPVNGSFSKDNRSDSTHIESSIPPIETPTISYRNNGSLQSNTAIANLINSPISKMTTETNPTPSAPGIITRSKSEKAKLEKAAAAAREALDATALAENPNVVINPGIVIVPTSNENSPK